MEEHFLDDLARVPWFANLGRPISPTSHVRRIFGWDGWPGPEDDAVVKLHSRHQALYESILGDAKDKHLSAEELWKNIHEVVFRVASQKVPYHANRDAWHAPSTAVWQAAWTAGLVGLYHLLEQKVPDDLEEQWQWYREGHWPCALEEGTGNERLVVY